MRSCILHYDCSMHGCAGWALARAFDSTSSLGMELDSLCDAVSFCLAPMVMLYSWTDYHITLFGMGAFVMYLCCGLLRLARFNATHTVQSSNFMGLPTPAAALFFASLVVHMSRFHCYVVKPHILAFLVFGIALLMVAPVSFFSFKSAYVRTFLRKYSVILGFLVMSGILFFGTSLMFVAIGVYIFANSVRYCAAELLERGSE